MRSALGEVRYKEEGLSKQFVWWWHARIWIWTQGNSLGEETRVYLPESGWAGVQNKVRLTSEPAALRHSPPLPERFVIFLITSFAKSCQPPPRSAPFLLSTFTIAVRRMRPPASLRWLSPYSGPPAFCRAPGARTATISANTFKSQVPPTEVTRLWFAEAHVYVYMGKLLQMHIPRLAPPPPHLHQPILNP